MGSVRTCLTRGAIAGAAGTTALNAVTYADMALRGRPASSTPEQTVDRAAELLGVPRSPDDDTRAARASGMGALLGAAAGVGAGLVLGGLRAVGWPRGSGATVGTAWVLAMLAGNGPMTVLGVTDPRTWAAKDWAADVAPHLAYAVAAAVTFGALDEADAGRSLLHR